MALRKAAADDLESDRLRYPADDGIPMEDTRHDVNHALLKQTLEAYLKTQGRPVFTAGNNFVYFGRGKKDNVGPDFYVVLGAKDDPKRDCWRVWNEDGLVPQVTVEMLSKRSGHKDRGKNFELYQNVLKVTNYFLCDHRRQRLEGYILSGEHYLPLVPDQHGRLYCEALGLWLGFHHDGMLRWYTPDGALLPTGDETARAERQRADAEGQRAEAERQRADAAEQRLRELEEIVRRLGHGDNAPTAS